MNDDILSSEELDNAIKAGITPTNVRVLAAQGRVRASHEALRARVTELTDAVQALLDHTGDPRDGYRTDHLAPLLDHLAAVLSSVPGDTQP